MSKNHLYLAIGITSKAYASMKEHHNVELSVFKLLKNPNPLKDDERLAVLAVAELSFR